MNIEGKDMRLQKWTLLEEEIPIVHVLVLLSDLPCHCFKKPFITPLLECVGKIMYLDTTSLTRTRAGMGKFKMEIDLTKTRTEEVWIQLDNEDNTIGRWHPIEYGFLPFYCTYYNHQGHNLEHFGVKMCDEGHSKEQQIRTEPKPRNEDVGKQKTQMSNQSTAGVTNITRQHEQRENFVNQHAQQPHQQRDDERHMQHRKNNKQNKDKQPK